MKTFLKSLKRQDGFTLVELMVVVAIIGLLSAVAVPNFKKYQAKAKISEAKLQLSAIYTAEVSFYSDFGLYANCLRYMGYDPSNETASRYYATGFFTNGAAARQAAMSTAAQNSGMLLASCPDAQAAALGTAANVAAVPEATFFYAGKGVGTAIISAAVDPAGANAAATGGTCSTNPPTGGNCIGTQADVTNQQFIAAAVGIISADAVTAATASGLTINTFKTITTLVTGF